MIQEALSTPIDQGSRPIRQRDMPEESPGQQDVDSGTNNSVMGHRYESFPPLSQRSESGNGGSEDGYVRVGNTNVPEVENGVGDGLCGRLWRCVTGGGKWR